MGNEVIYWGGGSGKGAKLTTHLHLLSRLRMNGATSFFFLFLHMVKCELSKFCYI